MNVTWRKLNCIILISVVDQQWILSGNMLVYWEHNWWIGPGPHSIIITGSRQPRIKSLLLLSVLNGFCVQLGFAVFLPCQIQPQTGLSLNERVLNLFWILPTVYTFMTTRWKCWWSSHREQAQEKWYKCLGMSWCSAWICHKTSALMTTLPRVVDSI